MRSYKRLLLLIITLIVPFSVSAISLQEHPKLQAVADQLVAENHYTQAELVQLFAAATQQQTVLDAMLNPAEYKFTWGKYRKLFLQEDRISQGVSFWQEHEDTLRRAEQKYGVPASVIVAIIGVESKFGKYRGSHKVLDSLVTLVIGYPRRSAFFAKELREFLILSKENKLDSAAVLGSYAGAVGYPQFISSSYRHYAVDFSGDGIVDLIDQPVDAIGSIANYFIENGWVPGEAVTSEHHLEVSEAIRQRANRKRKTLYTAKDLRADGALLNHDLADQEALNVLMLDASETVNEPRRSNVYVVRAGDTACQIAEQFKMSCVSLFKLNNLNSQGKIYRGQRLKLPEAKSQKVGKWSVKNNTDDASMVQERFFYTHPNFYAITKYNQSVLYAMAVHELSKAIASSRANSIIDTNVMVETIPETADEVSN
jgi:membrane-bound lytic murein transglycosylase B